MFRFIHAADIHLDSPLVGLAQYEGAPIEEIRGATRKAFENLIDLAIEEEVAFILIGGDLYDGDWKDYNTGLFFAKQMLRLREYDIQVFLVYGNHDAASQITKRLNLPSNVTAFPTNKANTTLIENIDVAIHGRGFAKRKVTEDITDRFPDPQPQMLNIGLLHTSANGREGHEPYAPCKVEGLVSMGYDYWALGHVHEKEILNKSPWIVFPGNIQGRHVRETGPKGCMLVTVKDQEIASVEHRILDVLRWAHCEIDVSGTEDAYEVIERVENAINHELDIIENRLLATRITLKGACQAHEELSSNPEQWINEIRQKAMDISDGSVWVEKVRISTSSMANLEQLMEGDTPIGDIFRRIGAIKSEGNEDLVTEFSDLLRKIPHEAKTGVNALDLESAEAINEIMGDVKQLLLTSLMENGGEQ